MRLASSKSSAGKNMTLSVEAWAEQVRAGNVRAVSRAITAIENHQQEAEGAVAAPFSAYGPGVS